MDRYFKRPESKTEDPTGAMLN
ncbi:hypothetical protein A2U01_0031583, partial [Trifolium medium]|nr:hypothetical protein [Trifolium medium]